MDEGTKVQRQQDLERLDDLAICDRHIVSLIAQLDQLLEERAQCNRDGGRPPDKEAAAAASLATPYRALPHSPQGFPRGRADLAREIIRQRRLRSDFLPAPLFAEPAWDMLLDLYAAHHEGKSVCVSSLCIAANVPSTTALRCIETMTEHGCLVRERDPGDGRRIFIALSETARAGIDAWLDAIGS